MKNQSGYANLSLAEKEFAQGYARSRYKYLMENAQSVLPKNNRGLAGLESVIEEKK